jgi:hypothetical protein
MRLRSRLSLLVLFTVLLAPQPSQAQKQTPLDPDQEKTIPPRGPEDADHPAGPGAKGRVDESSEIRERVLLYLRRHGDVGQIDPEDRLRRVAAQYTARESLSPSAIGGTTWVSIGPTNGAGRAVAVAPHPTTAGTLYIGAAGGGIWKTTNSGSTWTPLTDSINDLSVGAMAIDPSSPNTIYAGTGEGGYAIDFIPGIGLLKSTDAGVTWTLPASIVATKFYRILVNPSNSLDLVIGTNQGALRSADGGATWSTVISRATYGDVTDIVRDPTNSQILYAAAWGGVVNSSFVSKVLKSVDGGTTWVEKSAGLPVAGGVSSSFDERISLAISPSNTQVLYAGLALYNSTSGDEISHIYKTTNGGDSWSDLPAVAGSTNYDISHYLQFQGWYNNTLIVSPTDSNVLIAGGTYYIRTTDGGTTFTEPSFSFYPHVDAHDLRFQGSTLYVANDGGIWSSTDSGATWTDRNAGLVTRQFYALANDPVNRNRALAGAQDNGTSQRKDVGGTSWTAVVGGDGFECGINSMAPSIAYGTVQYGSIYRTKDAGGAAVFYSVRPLYASNESLPFLSILTLDPSNPTTVYTGSYRVWQSTTGGDGWTALPTTTTDGSTWSTSTIISSIAVAPSSSSILMAAKNAVVFRSTNGGQSWVSASSGLPCCVNNLEIDPSDPTIAYAAIATTSGQSVYQTRNGGTSWSPRSSGLPLFAAQVIRVDPTDPNVLYCGTDVGVYRSSDQGVSWTKFGTGLPNSSVQDLRILRDASILRVATHGRGTWELQVTPTGNTPPTATMTSPVGPQTLAKGTTTTFSGSVSDPDAGNTVTGLWTFPDTWETTATGPGASSLGHTFNFAGIFPVSLAAQDNRGALANAFVSVSVPEPGDNCATAAVIPASGPFPYTLLGNNEAAATAGTDPTPSCGFSPYHSVWFQFTPAVSATYEFSTCGCAVDTILSVFTGSACGPYTPVSCNDDAPGGSICSGTFQSVVTASGTAGQTLWIQMTGYASSSVGNITLTVRPTTVPTTDPRISGITRRFGPTTGTTSTTILGSNFASGAAVTFGGTAASVTFVDSGTLNVVTPAHTAGFVDVVVTNLSGATAMAGAAFVYVPVTLGVPSGVLASATSTTNVAVTWVAASGAATYNIYRSSSGSSYGQIGTSGTTSFNDTTASPGTAYLYAVRAVDASSNISALSIPDLATTVIFTDPTLTVATTKAKLLHVTELRSAVNAVRTLAGIGAFSFAASSTIKMEHINELRSALDTARTTLGLAKGFYNDSVLSTSTPIRAAHINDLRNSVK